MKRRQHIPERLIAMGEALVHDLARTFGEPNLKRVMRAISHKKELANKTNPEGNSCHVCRTPLTACASIILYK
jgi:hypothetical protein